MVCNQIRKFRCAQHRLADTSLRSVQAVALPLANGARFARNGAIIMKELSSATHGAETADGGLKPPRLVASPAAAAVPFTLPPAGAFGGYFVGVLREAIPLGASF